MTDLVVIAAFALLALAVVGSVAPTVPGPILSIAGVLLYWWSTGYASPDALLLAVLLVVGVLAVAIDLLAGVVGARAGGASTPTAVLAGVVGFLAFFLAGPLGLVAGVAGTVFVVVVVREGDVRTGGRAALVTTIGVLGSAIVQAMLTIAILVAMVLVVL
jgi:uncharacterized protein YqgC (DUF456 family)